MNADLPGLPAAAVPVRGADPAIALASTLHASATTAVLLGSGISSSANILTGWGVTLDLIRRYAKANGVNLDDLGDHPEVWWEEETGTSARYDLVLPALAPTDAARRDLLRTYFEKDPDGNPIAPTRAHNVLASLAEQGRVPVIVTTNFDRLLERALQTQGVDAQILTHPSAVKGMTPIQHAGVTVVKLHGDYAGGPLLNNPDELATYQPAWRGLLKRVFDEYGLLVVGWSGEYDNALARAMAESVGRRYAWYWATYRGQISEDARRLVNGRGAHVIDTDGADAFLTRLLNRVNALDRDSTRRQGARAAVWRRKPGAQSPPPGWTTLPLVHVRTVVTFGPVIYNEAGRIDGRLRRILIDKLGQSRLTQFVASLNETHVPASATADQSTGQPTTVVDATTRWEPSPGGFHTSAHTSYRLGGLGGAGSSALVQVLCPQVAGSDEIVLMLDMGLSYIDGVKATLLADLLHTSLMVLGTDLLPAVAQLASASTPMAQVEVHWGSPDVIDSVSRPIPATCQIDLSVFGHPTSARHSDASYSEYPPAGPLTPDSSKEIVLRALESVTLDSGYLDPDPGLVVIHTHLHSDA